MQIRFQKRDPRGRRKRFIALSIALVFLAGCASSPQERQQELGGLATVSALVIAMPLIPFAAAYNKVNGEKPVVEEKAEQPRQKLDPVYERRIQIIEGLDAAQQAESVFKSGAVAFFAFSA